MERVPVSVVIVTHDSQEHLPGCLEALRSDPEGPDEILVVDNASTDRTGELASGPHVRWIPLGENRGFGAACNVGAERASHDLVAVLNPDALPRPGWLGPLVEALADQTVGAAMATIELRDRPGHFNTSGGTLTYLGLSWASDVGRPIPEEAGPVEVPFPSGAAFAVRRDTLRRVGGFREEFFLYVEDADLGWRLRLLGLRSVRVPAARVAHDYEFLRNPDKLFHLERNRLHMVAANYRWDTVCLLLPALAAAEAAVVVVAVRDGWLPAKLRSWRALWSERDGLRRAHRRVQATRVVGDAPILGRLSSDFRGISQVRPPPGSAVAGALLGGYRWAVLPLVALGDRLTTSRRSG